MSLLKFFAAPRAHDVIDRAIQMHGARGLTDETPLAAMAMMARGARIYDGPDEVHRMVVARRILRSFARRRRLGVRVRSGGPILRRLTAGRRTGVEHTTLAVRDATACRRVVCRRLHGRVLRSAQAGGSQRLSRRSFGRIRRLRLAPHASASRGADEGRRSAAERVYAGSSICEVRRGIWLSRGGTRTERGEAGGCCEARPSCVEGRRAEARLDGSCATT